MGFDPFNTSQLQPKSPPGVSLRRMLAPGFALVLFWAIPSPAQVVWTGNTSTDWNTGSNWSNGAVPNSTTDLILDLGSGNQTTISAASATSQNLIIGRDSYSNASTLLTINNGQTLTGNSNGIIADQASSTGAVLVTGPGSTWSLSEDLDVGNQGAGLLTVANGANVSSSSGYLGNQAGSVGTAVVDGPNSTWNTPSGLTVGNIGTGVLTISNGGYVNSQTMFNYIGNQTGSHGTVTVDGTNSTWSAGFYLNLGNGASGCLTISNGGNVTGVGEEYISNGTMLVTGLHSTLNMGDIIVGVGGTGNLTVTNGGQLAGSPFGSSVNVGGHGGSGNMLVSGANSTVNLRDSLSVGTGTMTIANGGVVNSSFGSVGDNMTVDGANSTWNIGLSMAIGGTTGSAGNLTISNGGAVNITGVSSLSGTKYMILGGGNGVDGGSGTVLVTGTNSKLGLSGIALNIGQNAGTGILMIANGGSVTSGQVNAGYNSAGSNGLLEVTGANSTLDLQGNLYLGMASGAQGNLTIADGGMVRLNFPVILALNSGANGVVNLNGNGMLEVGGANGIQAGTGTAMVKLGGGTIQVTGSDLTTSVNATLINGSNSTINTNGMNATWSGVLGGSGSLAKIGAGSLTLSAANAYTGSTYLNGGTLLLDYSALGAPQSNIIDNATPLLLGGGNLILKGGNGESNNQSYNNTTLSSGDSAVGFNQNGANILNLNLGPLARNPGATANFSQPGIGAVNASGLLTGNVLTSAQGVAYATVSGSDWATLGGGNILALGVYQTDNNPADWQPTENVSLSAGTSTTSSTQSINTLRFAGNTTTGSLAVQSGKTLSVTTGGILITGNGNFSLVNGSITSGAAGSELVIMQNDPTNPFLIASTIADGNSPTMLVKSGPGQINLTGNNTFSGGTIINNGIVSFGAGTLGSGAVTFSGGTLQWAQNNHADISGQPLVFTAGGATLDTNGQTVTLAGSIGGGGAGNLAVSGNGTLALQGNNTDPVTGYAGATIISNGTVQFSAINNFGSGSIIFNNGTVQWAHGSTTDISPKAMQINGGGAIFDTNGNNVTLAAPIGLYGTGGLTKSGAGTLTLTNTELYPGSTIVNAGTLQLGDGTSNGMVAGNIVVNNGGNLTLVSNAMGLTYSGVISGSGQLNLRGGTLRLDGGNTFSGTTVLADPSATLILKNGLALQNSTLNLTAGNFDIADYVDLGEVSPTLGGLSGNLDLVLSNSTDGNRILTVGGNNQDTTYSGNITSSDATQSVGEIVKTGTGTLTLTGNNSYAGGTRINSGTLILTGNTAALGWGIEVNGTVIFNQAFDSSFNQLIFGNGKLTKLGSGNLILDNISTLTGVTTISAGTLTIVGSMPNGSIINNANLVVGVTSNNTYNGTISGNGTLTLNGAGILTLNANNTLTGNTTISTGTLVLEKFTALQNSTLNYNTGNGNLSFGSLTNATVGGLSGSKDLPLANNSSLALALTVGGNNQDTTFSGNLTGSGSLTKVGNGTLTISGVNSFSGNETVNQGTLTVTSTGSLAGGVISVGDANSANGTLNLTGVTQSLAGTVIIGNLGQGSLNLASGSNLTVSSSSVTVGQAVGANGSVSITGNSSWALQSTNLTIGNNGTGNVTVATGGWVNASNTYLGYNATASGTLQLSGLGNAKAYTMATGNLTIGFNGTGNLTITNGGNLSVTGGDSGNVALYLGQQSGSQGTALVTGAGSSISSTNITAIGYNGTGNLTIANGGSVTDTIGVVGFNPAGTGSVVVTGANSTWINSGNLAVGATGFAVPLIPSSGGNGSLSVTNGGNVSAAGLLFGQLTSNFGPTGQNGTVTVDGAGSRVAVSGLMAGGGNVTISNGGNVTVGGQLTLNGYNGTTISVTGVGSQLTVQGATSVATNYNNTLTINSGLLNSVGANGNNVSVNLGVSGIANFTGNANVLVTGNTANWNIGNQTTQVGGLVVGNAGSANLTIANGARITSYGASANGVIASLGDQAGSQGSVTVTGVANGSANSSVWELDYSLTTSAGLVVGNLGSGTLTVDGFHADVFGKSVVLGRQAGSSGTAIVANGGILDSSSAFVVGDAGVGNLTVNPSGLAEATSADAAGVAIYAGKSANSTGSIFVTGSGSDASAQLTNNVGAWNIGNLGNGNLTISKGAYGWGGSNTHDANGVAAYVGNQAGATGTVLVTDANSTWNLTGGSLVVGNLGNGTLTIANGANVQVGSNTTSHILLAAGAGSNGTVNLNSGGMLAVGGTNGLATGSGQYALNFGGGTLTTTGSDFSTTLNATLASNTTSTLNTSGANATWSGILSGNGSLTKSGSLTLTLSGNNTFSGTTTISSGTLSLGTALALQNSTLNDNSSTGVFSFGSQTAPILGGLSGNQNLALANNATAAVALTVGNNNQDSTFSGVLSGAGSLVKTGTGNMSLAGANTYSGTTNITAGNLILANSLALQNSTLNYNIGDGNINFGLLTNATLGSLSGNKNIVLSQPTVSGINGINLTVGANNASTTYNGNLSDTMGTYPNGSLTKVGNGTLTLTGNINYGGDTIVSSGTLNLSGTTATSPFAPYLYVFDNGSLVAQNGATLNIGGLDVANVNAQNSTVLITGANTSVVAVPNGNGGVLYVGVAGNGSMAIANGAQFTVGSVDIGQYAPGNGTLLVTDPGTKLTFGLNTPIDDLTAGHSGNGSLTIAKGII